MGHQFVTVSIEVDGTTLDNHLAVLAVTCVSTLGEGSTAELVLDSGNVSKQCEPGKRIKISLGYGDELVSAFSGTIETITLHYDEEGTRTSLVSRSNLDCRASPESEPLTITVGRDVYSFEWTWPSTENPRAFGRITIDGRLGVCPGRTLNIEGVDPAFAGQSEVLRVKHRLIAGTWTTSAQLKEIKSEK